jgi:hypothetical protein
MPIGTLKVATRNLESTGRRRDEFDNDRIAALRNLHVDLQLRNRETVDHVLRPNHESHWLACRHLNGRRLERNLPARTWTSWTGKSAAAV